MTRDVIDCDVHCAPRGIENLYPFLDEAWASFASNSGVFLSERTRDYPPGMGGGATPATLDELNAVRRNDVERHVTILSCTALDEIYRNPSFCAAVATAINDWLREAWLDRDATLRASMVVSIEDIDDAVAEVERLGGDDRFVQILLPVRANALYGERRFHPLYEAASRHGLAVALHAWGRPALAFTPTGIASTFLEDHTSNMRIVQGHVLSLVTEGVFERYEGLRIVLQECGFLWLPHLAARFDKEWRGLHREVPWVRHLPSEYIRRHMRATTAPAHLGRDPRLAKEAIEIVGADWLMYASDYPHEHGDDPSALWEALDEQQTLDVASGNAAAFYGLTFS
jgi:predicted TIM-barrel fold metal-dependent hydrolase